ncbi:MAG: polysaccharide deacetylase family protein [Actinomycetota bacterium]|nr:polysaccharide deacetylase family protein [Actinomycetota bacterium]
MKRYFKYFFPKLTYGLTLSIAGVIFLRSLPYGNVLLKIGRGSQSYILLFLVLYAALAIFASYSEYHGIGCQEGVFRQGLLSQMVAITFDDGPSPKNTPKILDILSDKGVKATFFLTGSYVDKYPELARRIVAEGHEIGNHTHSHIEMGLSKDKAILSDIARAEESIFRATGIKTNIFRPPRGFTRTKTRREILKEGYRIVLWTLSSLDWRGVKPKAILWRVKLFVRDGAIILFHDNGSLIGCKQKNRTNTIMALPKVIDFLFEEGYEIVKVSKMLDTAEEKAFLREA